MTARYNFYFNAKQAYNAGANAATTNIRHDYTRPLPFVITGLPEAAAECGGDMDRAVEKCAALIRLHSITAKPITKGDKLTAKETAFLNQNEFNPWARRAWLLMGKARLWSGENKLSQQALEFAAGQFKNNEEGWEAMLWLARLEAIAGDTLAANERMQSIANAPNRPASKLSKYLFAGIYADLLVSMERYENAQKYGELAVKYAKRGDEKTRCRMAMASLYEITGDLRRARKEYAAVVKKANSYDMSFHARVKRISLDAKIEGGGTAKGLKKMLRDEKNIDHYDQIYYALGEVALASGDTAAAMDYFLKAAAASTTNEMQKGAAYLRVANYHIERGKYLVGAQFYDSALTALPSTYANYSSLQTKGRALSRLAEAAQMIKHEDSLQRIAAMPEKQRLELIDGLIAKVKEEERLQHLEAQKEQRDRQFAMQNQYRNIGNTSRQNQGGNSGGWYFYNPSTISFGRTDFKLRWGNRKLEDNWRRKNKQDGFSDSESPHSPVDSTRETDTKKREYYLQDLPTNDSLLLLSNTRIARSYRQMGDVYRYELEAHNEAIESYAQYAKRFAHTDDAPEALYHAYITAQEAKLTAKELQLREELLRQYPESTYARRLTDPNFVQAVRTQNARFEQLYDSAMGALSSGQRSQARQLAALGISESRGGEFSVRFELLEALATGDAPGGAEQLNAIKAFAAKQHGTPQARYALDVLSAAQRLEIEKAEKAIPPHTAPIADSTISGKTTYLRGSGEHWVVAALPAKGNIKEQAFGIITFCVDWDVNLNLEVTESTLNENTALLVVKTFDNETIARAFAKDLEKEQPIEGVSLTVMPISPENFEKMTGQKSFSEYLDFYRSLPQPRDR